MALAACSPTATPLGETVPPALSTTSVPSPTAPPTSALGPTATAAGPFAHWADYAAIAGNVATGQPASDFSARLLGGATFALSERRGSVVVVVPTVVGCGDCIATMKALAQAYPDYRGRGIQVLFLNLYPDDNAEAWRDYVDLIGEPEFLWGVVNSVDFVVQYQIDTAGTILLVDRNGNLVFRNPNPISADDFRRLFALAI